MAAEVTVWPQLGTTVTLSDGVTVIDADGRVLVYTEEVGELIRGGQLLTYDPRVEPTTGPDEGPSGHALQHILGGVQEIDGRRLSLGDFVPVSAGYLSSLDDLTAPLDDLRMLAAHLNGIAEALAALQIRPAAQADFANYYSPVAAYLFSGSQRLTDRSGNGRTLTETGTYLPAPSHVAGLTATRFDGNYNLQSLDAALNITGAWSQEIVCNCDPTTASGGRMAGWMATGETEATNITWSIGASATVNQLGSVEWEQGAGVDVSSAVHAHVQPYNYFHLVNTRSAAGRFRTYINGVLVYEVTGLTMPTGGGSGRMQIGGSVGGGAVKPFTSPYLALYDQELTAPQVADLAQKRIGQRAA